MRAAVISHTYVEPENRGKLEALARAGVQLAAFVPSSWRESALQKEWTVTADRSGNLEIVPVPVRRTFKSPAGALWNLHRLNERLSRSELDLIQVEEEPWSVAARRAVRLARRNGIPSVIFTWQNLPGHPPWPLSALAQRTLRLADGWIAGNEAGKKLLARIDPSHPLTVLPQLGVSLPSESHHRPRHSGPLRVAFVGRLVEEKGVTDLIDAVANMQRPCTLTILGEGPAREALEAQTHGRGIIERITFRDSVPHADVAALWPTIDVLVLPSRTTPRWAEQFGHVLVEAMAHGVAVVGASSGAIPDVIGDAGLVVPERDPAALREALDRMASDRSRVEELGRLGRTRVERLYTDDAVAGRTIAFWKTLVETRERHA